MTAIYCKTCDKYYHLNCFELDEDDDEENEEKEEHLNEAERGNDTKKPSLFNTCQLCQH